MRSFEALGDEFAFRVLENRIRLYKEPVVEEISISSGKKSKGVKLIVSRYYNVNRLHEGVVVGVLKIDKDTLNALNNLKSKVNVSGVKEVVLVSYTKPSDKNAKEAENIIRKTFDTKIHLTFLHGGNYPMFNIMRHFLVPPHILLNEEEKAEIFNRYNVEEPTRLPLIKEKDPVARLIGAKRGDLIMIIRESETAGRSLYYRYVVRAEDILIT